jgi:hypothetical protein
MVYVVEIASYVIILVSMSRFRNTDKIFQAILRFHLRKLNLNNIYTRITDGQELYCTLLKLAQVV